MSRVEKKVEKEKEGKHQVERKVEEKGRKDKHQKEARRLQNSRTPE